MTELSSQQLTTAMVTLLGREGCISEAADIAPYVTDYKGVYTGASPLVVRPKSAAEVAEVVKYCRDHDVKIVPQGGNTSMSGASVPDASNRQMVLSLARMNKVLDVDVLNDTITVQAGCTLAQVRDAARAEGRLFALRIGSEGTCQIGGNLSTNAGGTAVVKYGNMREQALGLEVVLPDGRIWSGLRGLRKDNTGYDLKHLFIGAEGTLGIITAAVLKLAPLPTARSVALVAVPDVQAAIKLLGLSKSKAGQDINAFELISPDAMVLVLEHLKLAHGPLPGCHGWQVLIELTSSGAQESVDASLEELLEAGAEAGLVVDAAIASNEAQINHMWKIREEISDAQTRAGGSVRCDISVPISKMAAFIEGASARVQRMAPDTRMVIYGHVGDGNVHFNPLRPRNRTAAEFVGEFGPAITGAADGLAISMTGSISAEHGVGLAKRDDLQGWKSTVELDLMRRVKAALDPQGMMNPGKVLPPELFIERPAQ